MMAYITFLLHKRSKKKEDTQQTQQGGVGGETPYMPELGQGLRLEIGGKERIGELGSDGRGNAGHANDAHKWDWGSRTERGELQG
jgi:hypothetical protein